MQYYSIILMISVIACYWNALFCGFVFDDASAIRENQDLRPETPWIQLVYNDFWGTPLSKEHSHKSYRPLTVATFRINYYFGGLDPVGYHFLNVCFHLAAVLLFYEILKLVFVRDVSFTAALLFSVHPIHCEAVTGAVGRAECLSGIAFMLAIYFYLSERWNVWAKYFAVFVLSFASTFSKEQGITVLGVLITLEFLRQLTSYHTDKSTSFFMLLKYPFGYRRFCLRAGALIAMASVIIVIRFFSLKGSLPAFTSFDNPASAAGFPVRQLTYNYLVAFNSWLLLNPNQLCADWSMGTIPLVTLNDTRIFAIFAIYSVLVLLTIRAFSEQCDFGILFALSLLILPFIPASNLFFPVGFVIAERVLYLPSLGYSLLVALGLHKLCSYLRFVRPFFYVIFILLALKTLLRNFDWRNDFTLFQAGLRVSTTNAKIWNNIGHYFERRGEFAFALPYFQNAAMAQPDDVGAWMNIGRTFSSLNDSKRAEKAFLKAKSLLPQPRSGEKFVARVAPSHLNVFINLGNLYKNMSKFAEAENLYRQAITMRPDFVSPYLNLGGLLLDRGSIVEAEHVFSVGLTHEPANADLLYNFGIIQLRKQNRAGALAKFQAALVSNPHHFYSLVNAGIILAEQRDERSKREGKRLLERALDEKADPNIVMQVGMIEYELGMIGNAEVYLEKAVQLDTELRSARVNLALVKQEMNKIGDARSILEQATREFPDYCRMSKIKTEPQLVEACFKHMLQLDPRSFHSQHNLCIFYIDSKRKRDAADCIVAAKRLTALGLGYAPEHAAVLDMRFNNELN